LETRKVRVLLHGITDSRLVHAKSQVLATPALKDTFETALHFIAQFLDKKRSYDNTTGRGLQRNVSAMSRTGRQDKYKGSKAGKERGQAPNRSPKKPSFKGPIVDCYYCYDEWTSMTKDQQQKVRDLKAAKDNEEKRKAGTTNTDRSVKYKNDKEDSNSSMKHSNISPVVSQRNIREL
jgi:hypothetical protein